MTTHAEDLAHSDAASADACACAEGRRFELSRRGMLKALGGTALLGATLGDTQLAFGATATGTEHVLVTIVLAGGIDGLSMVVPLGDPAYAMNRPGIAVPASLAHQVDSMFGLHPSLEPLFPLWSSGRFGAVHAVGQEAPTRSHFAAMEELERAAPGSSLRTGWLARTLGVLPAGGTMEAVALGQSAIPGSLRGPQNKIAANSLADISLPVNKTATPVSLWKQAMTELHAGALAQVSAPMRNALDAVAIVDRLAAPDDANSAAYPDSSYGRALRDVARLITSGTGLRLATVQLGGWDLHEGFGGPTSGGSSFAGRLSSFAQGLAAFVADLGPAFNQVSVLTVSEFGRRPKENGSGGLDHGHGNAMLLLGGKIKGGKVYGTWPTLAPDRLDNGFDLAHTTDYRTVIAEILTTQMGIASTKDVFPGLSAAPLGVTRTG